MNERILIIDDDKKLVARYREILEKGGYQIDTAYNGKEGLEKLKEKGADLVILDLKMPKMDGVKVLEVIRDDEALRKTKVLVISSYAYKNALTWYGGKFTTTKRFTRTGRKAAHTGETKTGEAEKFEILPKQRPEMKEVFYFGGRDKYPESEREFQNRLKRWLLDSVEGILKAKPQPLEREKAENEPDRVLIVDDEKTMVEKIASWLKPEGYELLFAYDGGEALEKIAKEDIDLVILDLKMPDTTGEDVIRVMRSIPVVNHIPIVVFTSVKDTTTTDSLMDIMPTREFIDETNIRSRIHRYKYALGETYDKPKEDKFLRLLHLDKPRYFLARVKKELTERRRLGYGYKKYPITLLRSKKCHWLEGYLEGYESYYGGEHCKCAYCEEEDKYPALEYRKMSTWSPPRICGDCAKELKAKYPSYPKNL